MYQSCHSLTSPPTPSLSALQFEDPLEQVEAQSDAGHKDVEETPGVYVWP